jgi:hypothetical protein
MRDAVVGEAARASKPSLFVKQGVLLHDAGSPHQAMEPSWRQVQAAVSQQQWGVLEAQLAALEVALGRARQLVEGYVQPMLLQRALRFLTSKLDFDDLSGVSNSQTCASCPGHALSSQLPMLSFSCQARWLAQCSMPPSCLVYSMLQVLVASALAGSLTLLLTTWHVPMYELCRWMVP